MLRRAIVCLFVFGLGEGAATAEPPAIPPATARAYFAEAARLCAQDAGRLWGRSLCGPLMFADPPSRQIVASQADARQALRLEDGLYVGTLPASEVIANTAFTWSGVYWTQVAWPLPEDAHQRAVLLMHEAFHRIQGEVGLPPRDADNAHLDSLDGRYLMQLEWRALARALSSKQDAAARAAARDALTFRARRYQLFPQAATAEPALELHEGLAEYTGIRIGLSSPAARTDAALSRLSGHSSDPSFIRSFAYATGPALGLLLDRWSRHWRRQLAGDHGPAELLSASLEMDPAMVDARAIDARAASYDGAALHAAEVERDRTRRALIARYRAALVEGPVLTLRLLHMKVQFNPRNLVPLAPEGTVYPRLRVTDDWGELEANEGALLESDWSAVSVAAPTEVLDASARGNGWTLTLSPGWKIVPGARTGDLVVAPAN
jgi:hypothetical protein